MDKRADRKVFMVVMFEDDHGVRIIQRRSQTPDVPSEYIGMGTLRVMTPQGPLDLPIEVKIEAAGVAEAFDKAESAVKARAEEMKKEVRNKMMEKRILVPQSGVPKSSILQP